MRRRSRPGGKSADLQPPKTAAPKSRIAPKAGQPRSTTATLETEVARLIRERDEALQQQRATADVLKVISRSAFDLESVVATLVASAARLCEADRGLIFLRQDNQFRMATNYGFSPELEAFARANPFPIDSASTTIRAAMSGSAVQAVDVLADETQGWLAREYQRLGGHRTNLGVPLRRDGSAMSGHKQVQQTGILFDWRYHLSQKTISLTFPRP
jgi:hypothetical protein